MVNYQCTICLREFDRKSSYVNHTENKKKLCQAKLLIFKEETPVNTEKSFNCSYCDLTFSRRDLLTRYMNKNICKVKHELYLEKEKIFKLLLEKKRMKLKTKTNN